ncbi:MAG: hypothetical protein J6U17_04655 [Kiritimatiellae bacterium]|nr:hypothetical protein [Kiritimatiellia bacterium]
MTRLAYRAAAALVIAALLAGCGDDAQQPQSAPAAAPAPVAAAPELSAAAIAKPMDEQVALERRAGELAAKLESMSEDDPSRGEVLAEVERLRREIGRANAARLKRDAEEAKRLILEQRRGGAK